MIIYANAAKSGIGAYAKAFLDDNNYEADNRADVVRIWRPLKKCRKQREADKDVNFTSSRSFDRD